MAAQVSGRIVAYDVKAGDVLTVDKVFALDQEPAEVRDRYGRGTFGQSCLMARRLIEEGVRYVTVNHFDTVFGLSCWDMHADGGGWEMLYCPPGSRWPGSE